MSFVLATRNRELRGVGEMSIGGVGEVSTGGADGKSGRGTMPSLPLIYLVTHAWFGAGSLPEAAGSTDLGPQA